MPSLWPLRRDVAERPLADQRFSNPSLPNVTSPIGKGLGGNTTTLPLAVDIKPIDFGPILNSDVGPGPLIDYRQGLIRNLTAVVTRALPFFTPAASVDWRDRYGGSWLATIQDQGPCGNCWSFAATALTETMIRIEHNVWSKRSEADLRDNWGLSCAHGANVNDALDWAINHGGISDLDCVPWHFDDDNYYPCPDRSGRLGRLPQKTYLGSIDDQKKWLDTVGPIVASFTVHYDFFGWTGPDPYKYDGTSAVDGGHVVLLVGYDDSKSCWIARNSWGSGWGEQGYFLIRYGTADIDTWAKTGLSNLDPDPWSKRRLHNGNLLQSGNGPTHRNFELAVGSSPVRTAYRQGEAPLAWHAAYSIEDDGDSSADGLHPGFNCMGQPALTETSYNRDLDMVYWERGGYMRRWYFSQSAQQWQNTGRVGDGHTAGYPSYIESAGGGFEIVVRSDSGTLDHWYRRPDSAWDWFFGGSIASDIMQSGPTLVQGNVGIAGNLYVVAVLPSGQMQLFWRDSDAPGKPWHAGEIFGGGVGNTPPVMVQGTFGTTDEKTPGNFELVVVVNGQAEHWWRANADLASNPPHAGCEGGWKKSATFGSGLRHAWGLVHGAYGDNLELIVEESSGKLAHWYRVGTGAWYESTEINV